MYRCEEAYCAPGIDTQIAFHDGLCVAAAAALFVMGRLQGCIASNLPAVSLQPVRVLKRVKSSVI